jgi:two-component system phosphate regulon response regulator PhoB
LLAKTSRGLHAGAIALWLCDEREFPECKAIVAPKVVLVVDEDDDVRAEIRECLANRQITCREASTARDALRSALDDPPDLILVDLVLPDQSGLGLCRIVRESPVLAATPIIVLTSRASEIDRVLAFESGVDDFLAKPFYPPELGARVSAVLRGFVARSDEPAPLAPAGSAIQLDPRTGRVIADGRRVELTPRERELLSALIAQAGRVVRRSQLIDRLQVGREPRSERAIDAHIKSIRRKLGPARGYVETVRGVGYRLAERAIEPGDPDAFTES